VALAIAEGRSYQDAANLAGVAKKTVTRWMADPAFRQWTRELGSEAQARLAGRLAALNDKAMDRLAALLDSANEAVALGAVKEQQAGNARARQMGEFADRLAVLEKAHADRTVVAPAGPAGEDPGPGADLGGQPDPEAPEGGPAGGDDAGGADAGPVAAGDPGATEWATLCAGIDADAVRPPERQEHGRGRAGGP
jgi:hypothetical protein